MAELNILFIGAPGSGKGTQSFKLAQKKNLIHLSTGDLFRNNLKQETDLGLLAKSYIDKGQLVPDSVTTDMVADFVKKISDKKGIVFDGFPRNLVQAKNFKKILSGNNRILNQVIFFKISNQQVIARLTGRLYAQKSGLVYHVKNNPPKKKGVCDVSGETLITRTDDNPEVIAERLDIFHKNTEALLNYYKKENLLKTIDAFYSPNEVFNSILKALES
ncbi:MAG: adenylate kinase [Bdellovibrionaceae bacterium]|nr:adenylate kinase [Pseudobdellovibrionaceae bacterium]